MSDDTNYLWRSSFYSPGRIERHKPGFLPEKTPKILGFWSINLVSQGCECASPDLIAYRFNSGRIGQSIDYHYFFYLSTKPTSDRRDKNATIR